MTELFTRKLNLPKIKKKSKKTGKYTYVLATLNNVGTWIRWSKTKIKNEYKAELKEYYLPEPEAMYDELTIDYRLIRHTNMRLDKDNIVFALKWIADTLEELGYIKDDKVVNFRSFDTIYDKSLPETMFQIRVSKGTTSW